MSASVVEQPSLCRTWSETQKIGFLVTWLMYLNIKAVNNKDADQTARMLQVAKKQVFSL